VRGNKSAYRCPWSANLRNATVVARGAVRKRPAVQIGQGQMCRLRSRDGLHFTKAGAGADRKRSSVTDLRCRPARGRVDPRANFRLAQGRKRTWSAGRGLRNDLCLHLQGRPMGRAVMALSHAPAQTPPPRRSRPSQDTIKDRVSIHERPKKVDTRTEGGHWAVPSTICAAR
jgi:hypothetical protein